MEGALKLTIGCWCNMVRASVCCAQQALGGQAGWWEAQCVVLLWLSQMVLLPFNLALLDSSLSADSK